MRIDPVAEHIHKALGLPPPDQEQPRRRVDRVLVLAKRIEDAAESWARGGEGITPRLWKGFTDQQIADAKTLASDRALFGLYECEETQ